MRHLAPVFLLALFACKDKGTADDTGDSGTDPSIAGALSVAFLSPADGSRYTDDTDLSVEIAVSDAEGGSVEGLSLAWSGEVLVGVDLPTATDADGGARIDLPALGWGIHTVAVQVRRSDGASVIDAIAFEIVNPDADFDGYRSAEFGGEDCDDEDPTINPSAEEFCDGQDNDCNGEIDGADASDVKTWYEDLDADGYGVTDIAEISCQEPKDYVLLPGDCDDEDAAIHPGAAEVCDDLDNDCDGLIDDDDDGLQTASASAWYPDRDGDGYGDYSEYALACIAPDGWIDEGGDCDDDDDQVNPGADELCDGRDNNCRDGVDEEGAIDAPTWYADADDDDWGLEDDTVQACDEPEYYATDFGDCDDDDAGINPDAVEICNDGVDNNCDDDWVGCVGDLHSTGLQLLGESRLDEGAYDFANVGDVDGDGIDDLIVGARTADTDDDDAGRAYLVLGPVDGELSLSDADAIMRGVGERAHAGRSVAGGVDATDDGGVDLLIAGPGTADWASQVGVVDLVRADDALSDGTMDLDDSWHRFIGEESFGYLGVGVALLDMNEDGAGDLLMGASHVDEGGTDAGAVYLFTGPIAMGETDLRDGGWDARILGAEGGDQVGVVLDARADIDGDGEQDLVLGVPQSGLAGSTAGAVTILSGLPSGEVDLADADASILGTAAGDVFGSAVAWLSDIDGDGYDDLAAGAPGNDVGGASGGAAYIFLGSSDLSGLDGQVITDIAHTTVIGADSGGQLGQTLAGDGDHDGDGAWDLLIGVPTGGPTGDGAALLYLGGLSGSLDTTDADATWAGDTTTGGVGYRVRFGGSSAGGDSDALLIGARTADLSGADAGALLLVDLTDL